MGLIGDFVDMVGDILKDAGPAITNAAIAYVVSGGNWAVTGRTFVATLAATEVSKALAKKPERPVFGAQGRMVTIRQPIAPHQIIVGQARVGGVLTFAHISADNTYFHIIITMSGHVSEEITTIYFDADAVPLDGGGNATGKYAGYVRVKKSLGDEAGQPFPDLVTESDGKWTDAHRQTGRTKIYVRLTKNRDLFPQGVPNITALVKGAKLLDPRTDTTAWSDNAALWVAHYLANSSYGMGADYAEINETDLNASADICDESVALAAGGSEKRYTVNGAFDTSRRPSDVLGLLLACMAGKAVNAGAQWHIHAGGYTAPTVTLDEGDLAGPITVQTLVSRRESCNGVKGVFVDPSTWQPTDFPAIASAAYMAEDGGARVWKDIDLTAFCTSGTQAQRLAKIELLRSRQGLTANMACKFTAWRVVAGGTVAADNARLGWSAKPFEVVASSFSINGDGTLGVNLGLRETSAAIYDWATSEEQAVDLAPNSNLPDPWVVGLPGAPVVSETLYATRDGAGVKTKAIVTCSVSGDAAVEEYSLEYKLTTASQWVELAPQHATYWELNDIAPGYYDFRVRAINTMGVRGDYVASRKEIYGLLAIPADITGLSLQAVSALAVLTFTQSSDLDVRMGGKILVRHATALTGATWEGSVSVCDPQPGSSSVIVLPLISGTYLVKAEDSSGLVSANAASISSNAAMIETFTSLSTVQEDATFTGSKTNCSVTSGTLRITTLSTPSGTYSFASGIDLTTVKKARLTATVVASTMQAGVMFDSRTGDMDTWGNFDGAVDVAAGDCSIEVRETPDDPAGSPTWGAWKRLTMADFYARAFQFRAQLTTGDAAYNVAVEQLRVKAEELA